VQLGVSTIACPACHATSPVPANVAHRLAEAERVLHSVHARRRQFGKRTGWLLVHAWARAALFAALVGVLVIPFGCLAWIGIDIAGTSGWDAKDLNFVLPCVTPLLIVMGAGGLGLLLIGRRAQRLRLMCAATPPAAPGQPAGCYVCGGPVAGRGTEPIARCGYCSADNVVTPKDMARAHASRSATLDGFEDRLRTTAHAAGRGVRRLFLSFVAAAAVAPLLGTVGGCCMSMWILSIDTPADLTREYVWIDGTDPGSRCIGRVRSRTSEWAYVNAPDYVHVGGHHELRLPAAGLEVFHIDALVGQRVARRQRDGRYRVGEVTGVHGQLDGDNIVVMEMYGMRASRFESERHPHAAICIPQPGAPLLGNPPAGWP